MVAIVPAVLPKTFEELEAGLERLRGISRDVQVDLVGHNVLAGRDVMPLWQEFDFEIDVMLPDAPQELDALVALGPSRVIIHAQYPTAREALEKLQSLRDGNYPVLTGVALLPSTTPEALEEFTGLYDFVQVMGIRTVGSQGQPFDARAIELVRRLRAIHAVLPIQVDGAAATHPKELADAGADRLIVGSAIIHAEDPSVAYKDLLSRANQTV